jgi:hypothetical protein
MKKISFLLMIIIVFFGACNTVKKTFENDLQQNFVDAPAHNEILTENDISSLPIPVQKYLSRCGFVGKEKVVNAEVIWSESAIKMAPEKDWMKLKTIQFNSCEIPFRIAYMKAHIAGIIPFDGRDIFSDGQGQMLGKIANLFTVFDAREREISQSALAIILAEALLIPGYALSDYIYWEEVDDRTAIGTIQWKGIVVKGKFYFNDNYEMTLFETFDRYWTSPEGNVLAHFTAEISNYKKSGDYIIPGTLTAIWNIEHEGKDIRYDYWKGNIEEVRYNIRIQDKNNH